MTIPPRMTPEEFRQRAQAIEQEIGQVGVHDPTEVIF